MNESVSIPMRCAETGKKFHAHFYWNNSRKSYVITDVVPEEPGPQAGYGRSEVVNHHAPAGPASPDRIPSKEGSAPAAPGPAAYEAKTSEIDWDGFYCPHCGHKSHPSFVKCGVCKELVCGARVIRGNIRNIFRCHDGCGHQGELGGAPISSYSTRPLQLGSTTPTPAALPQKVQATLRQDVLPPPSPSERKVLPAPQPRVLPPPERKVLPPPRRLGLPGPDGRK